eukprot:TRINITY_DN4590_c0_g1_i3.p1 TRINITY_DN4590_c0_g1~~TRINITY_DN4590_c0_g1_i3.p1  ORF type:complete len:959 (+),score=192.59 TRINITY_DN4590_c0_g1_i3:17-2893(+)
MAQLWRDQRSDDDSRVHSHFEFLLSPDLLDSHLDNLKNKIVAFPSGVLLIRGFLKEARKYTLVNKPKATVLLGFAAKVCHVLELSLQTIEEDIPQKWQRELLAAIVANYPSESATLDFHLWVVRGSQTIDPKFLLNIDRPPSNVSPEQHQSYKLAVEKYIAQSVEYLTRWCKNSAPSDRSIAVWFQLGEFFLSHGKYEQARECFQKLTELFHERFPTNLPSTVAGVDVGRVEGARRICESIINPSELKSHASSTSKLRAALLNLQKNDIKGKSDDSQKNDEVHEKIDAEEKSDDPRRFDEILEILALDIVRNEISPSFRFSLERNEALKDVRSQILSLNLVWKAIREDTILWDYESSLVQPPFLLKLISETSSRYVDLSLELRSSFMNSPFGPDPKKVFNRRLRTIVRSLCYGMDDASVWNLATELVPDFLLPGDEPSSFTEKVVPGSFGEEALEPPKKRRRLETDFQEIGNHVAFSRQFCLFLASQDPGALLKTMGEGSVEETDLPLLKLFKEERKRRGNMLVKLGKLDSAKQLFLGQEGEKREREKGDGATKEREDSCPWELLEVHSLMGKDKEDIFLEKISENCETGVVPEFTQLALIFASLLNSGNWSSVQPCAEKILSTFSDQESISSICKAIISLSNLLITCEDYKSHSLISSISDFVSIVTNSSPSSFDEENLMQSPLVSSELDWNHETGLLSLITSKNVLTVLSCVVSSVLHRMRGGMTAVQPEKYGALSTHIVSEGLFKEENLWWVKKQLEEKTFYFWKQVLCRQSVIDPSNPLSFFGMGECDYESRDFLSAVKNFLAGGTLESQFWSQPSIPPLFTASIKHLINSLFQLRRWGEVIVLHQFAPVINYAEVFRIVREKAAELPALFLEFVWDMAIAEIIIFTFANLHPDAEKLELMKVLITKPEVNQYNPARTRKKLISSLKLNFLRGCAQEFLLKNIEDLQERSDKGE